ncbi:MAG: resistance-nodulation-cell division efflux transporter [Betaproteobacteria bacterium]|nr:MAG: resistance-nodulation-cell division efflux transporter [Betaproteobacteria bacterium]
MNPEGRFNLTAAALRHRELTLFFILVIAISGFASYFKLGQREDPDFTFRAMVIRTMWPGATAEQVDKQVTDRIEKKLQEIPFFRHTRSYSKPGESLIILELHDTARGPAVADAWYQVRKKIGDIRHTLPEGVAGPFYNDEFGDVFGSIYAFTADGFTHSELRDHVEAARQRLLKLKNVAKIDLVGIQDDRIFIELSTQKLAALGLDAQQIAQALATQNAVVPAGAVNSATHTIPLRVTGELASVAAVADTRVAAAGRSIRIGDIARVWRDYVDPPISKMYYRGQQAIGLAVSMTRDGDVLKLGEDLAAEMERIRADLPIGVEFAQVSDQPRIVKTAVGDFMRVFLEALGIVLLVSFLSLGLRTGLVVAITIPWVVAATFLGMRYFGIDLHRISTGALIIALGLLVDDAMIAVEMMSRKIEQGLGKLAAAAFAWRSTAFPMLTGTLITAAGFLPIGTAKSATGEYTFAIFAVVTLALLISWVAAVTVTPFLGNWILKGPQHEHAIAGHDVFNTPFYARLRGVLDWCLANRKLTMLATAGLFVLGVAGMGLTEKQFFPNSNRPEVLVELWLPEGSSIKATEKEAKRLEAVIAEDADVASWVTYVGNGSPRYFLSLDQQLFRSNFAQTVILSKDLEGRERIVERLRKILAEDFPGIRARANRVALGPPVSYPVQFRVSGTDIPKIKEIADRVAAAMRASPHTMDVNHEWGQRAPMLRVDVDQDKARALGVSTASVSRALQGAISGATVAQFRENDRLIDIVLRAPEAERDAMERVLAVQVPTAAGRYVPVTQVATVREAFEEPILWRRSRELTLTVRADIVDGVQAPDVAMAIDRQLAELRATLPVGYRIEIGGSLEESGRAQESINAGMPMMLAVVLALLMIQLQSFARTFMVLLTAPLGLIGVALALLVFRQPFGFVAMLGTIALGGMIMRNTVILVDQIEQDIKAGEPPWVAIREATVRRFRPIMLTAAAAMLAMIPLTRNVLWGPMAFAIMGGLLVATVLTVLFVPALYAAWFRVKPVTMAE